MNPRKTDRRGNNTFNAQVFLDTSGVSRKMTEYRRNESIYAQGGAATTVMYVQKGGVKLSVVNGSGKEAVVAMFGPTDLFGEGCMAGQTIRMGTARAVSPTTLLVMQKDELLRVLHEEHELSDHFIAYIGSQHPDRRGSGRPTVQFKRKSNEPVSVSEGFLLM